MDSFGQSTAMPEFRVDVFGQRFPDFLGPNALEIHRISDVVLDSFHLHPVRAGQFSE